MRIEVRPRVLIQERFGRCLREPLPVCTHGSPPGVYWYQIGTVSGPRLSPALTDKAANVFGKMMQDVKSSDLLKAVKE